MLTSSDTSARAAPQRLCWTCVHRCDSGQRSDPPVTRSARSSHSCRPGRSPILSATTQRETWTLTTANFILQQRGSDPSLPTGRLGNYARRKYPGGRKFPEKVLLLFPEQKKENDTRNLHKSRKRSGYKHRCIVVLLLCNIIVKHRQCSWEPRLVLDPYTKPWLRPATATATTVVHYLKLAASCLLPLPAWSWLVFKKKYRAWLLHYRMFTYCDFINQK